MLRRLDPIRRSAQCPIMLLYDVPKFAPNPRRVRIYLAEKGISVPTKTIDLVKREQKGADYLALYPPGQVPSLVLDDGRVIGESIAICRYFEALHPDPPLFGSDAISIAETDMWLRRVELTLMQPVGQVWVNCHPLTAKIVPHQYKDFGEANRPRAFDAMARFDARLADHPFLAGDAYSIADIVLLTTVDFAAFIGLAMPDNLPHLADWHRRVSDRPSAAA